MYQLPRCPGYAISAFLLWLALGFVPVHGRATASPLIAVSPDSIGPIELPWLVTVQVGVRIYDRDSHGPTPLTWTISDVMHGTNNDVPWVMQSPTSGTIAPADSQYVAVILALFGVAGGEYRVDLIIDSNDPVHPRVIVPLKFTIVAPVPVRRFTFGELKAKYR